MDKKNISHFAIGIIVLVAIVMGGLMWLLNEGSVIDDQPVITLNKQKTQPTNQSAAKGDCAPHYYEGEAKLVGWLASSNQPDASDVVIRLKDGEAKKLPTTDSAKSNEFTVKLVDPTDEIKKELINSTSEKPVTITVLGYAEICQQPPLVSLRQATVAFKKS